MIDVVRKAGRYLMARSRNRLGSKIIDSQVGAANGQVEHLTADTVHELVAVAQKWDALRTQVVDLMQALDEHKALEGEAVDLRRENGTWSDLSEFTDKMVRNL